MGNQQSGNFTVYLDGEAVLLGSNRPNPPRGVDKMMHGPVTPGRVSDADAEKIEDAIADGKASIQIQDRLYTIVFERT